MPFFHRHLCESEYNSLCFNLNSACWSDFLYASIFWILQIIILVKFFSCCHVKYPEASKLHGLSWMHTGSPPLFKSMSAERGWQHPWSWRWRGRLCCRSFQRFHSFCTQSKGESSFYVFFFNIIFVGYLLVWDTDIFFITIEIFIFVFLA